MTPVLETERLILRPLELADADQVQELFPKWEIVRHLDARVPWPYPPDGAYTYYRDIALPSVARGEGWHWTLRMKTAPEKIIGSIALMRGGKDNRGFWIGLPWQRQGLMTEACAVVNDFWFSVLGFPVLRVAKAASNLASRRISEKEGMRLVGTEERQHVSGRVTAELWEITSEEWRARPCVTPRLETPRLFLRPLELADADQAEKLFPQWEIVKYLVTRVPWPYPLGTAHRFYRETALPEVAAGNAWYWTLRLKTDPGRLIGSISLTRSETDNRGFWIGLPWQRQGLMTEACDAVTDYWFNVLNFPVLRAPKAVANIASRRISEKQGMRIIASMERDYISGRLPAELWEITREEWNRRRSKRS